MNNIRLDLFGYIKKAAKMLLIFIRNQVTTCLIIKAIELVAELNIRLLSLIAD